MEAPTRDDAVNPSRGSSVFAAFFAAGLAFAVQLFVTIAMVAFLGSIVPRYVRFFEVHDTLLPAATQLLISLSMWNMNYWFLFVLAIIVIDGPIALGVQFLPNRLRWLKVCWFDSYLLLAIVFLFFSSIALCVPIQGMLDQATAP